MTELERKMYQITGAISATNAPVIFKGALITKLILAESGFTTLIRQTRDIDANWIGSPPTMDDLVDMVNRSLGPLEGGLLAVAKREYGEKRTAGLSIIETATNATVITMDIGIRAVTGSKLYYYGDIEIRGVLPIEIIADKIFIISGGHIFRRAKDLVDVYALAHCVHLSTSELYDVLASKGRTIGSFIEFHSRQHDLEHAYGRLMGVEGKPTFDEVYSYLDKFIAPFAAKDKTPKTWDIDNATWDGAS